MAKPPKDQDELTEEEAAKRRDEVLKKMLNTPPKPRKKEAQPIGEDDSIPSDGKKTN